MRQFDALYEPFYLSEEDRGILARGLNELQNSNYIDEETFDKAMALIVYLCEEIEPEEQN